MWFFLKTASALCDEEIVKHSAKGKKICNFLQRSVHVDAKHTAAIAIKLTSELCSCLAAAEQHKLPSAVQASMWSNFHKIRCKKVVHQVWASYVSHLSPALINENKLALQLILDRMFKAMMGNEAESRRPNSRASKRPLTTIECNAIRYMAGYVAVSLLKKAKKSTKNIALRRKRQFFVEVLERMKALQQPGESDSVLEYTTHWSELIDRGGLYHINDDVFKLFEHIEIFVREELDTKSFNPIFVCL